MIAVRLFLCPVPALRAALCAAALLLAPSSRAQQASPAQQTSPDAAVVAPSDSARAPLSPRRVVRRALVAPGWGQLTNRQPVKAAVVWGTLGATGAGVAVSQVQYLRLRHAALFRRCESAPDPAVCTGIDGFADEAARYPGIDAATLRGLRDAARRRRDLFVLATATAYALQSLDAYVSAHLRLFDDGSDLSIGLAAPADARAPVSLALRVRLP